MIDFDQELRNILESDPLGLLEIKPKASGVISADERLIASFEEINAFMQVHDREPAASRDISERKLYSRLKGLRESPEKAAALAEFDSFGLLGDLNVVESPEINTIDAVLESDPLGILAADPDDIFTLKNIPKSI